MTAAPMMSFASTDDITFSSSSLLNRFFDIHDPKLRGFLELQRERQIAAARRASFSTRRPRTQP